MESQIWVWCTFFDCLLVMAISNAMCEAHTDHKTMSLQKTQEPIINPPVCKETYDDEGKLIDSCKGQNMNFQNLVYSLPVETNVLKINCEETSLDMSFPGEMNEVKELNLMYCSPEHLDVGIAKLTQLQSFILSHSDVSDISAVTRSLRSLAQLKYLSLSGNSGIKLVRKVDILPLNSTSLEYLDLSGCEIGTIHRDAFENVPRLRSFDFSQNPINEAALKNLTVAIKRMEIERLHLKDLRGLRGFPTAALRELTNTSLEYLDMSDNQFPEVPEKAFYHPFLKNLKLSNSKISSIHPKAFFNTFKLETIDLRENNFLTIKTQLNWSPKLRVLDFSKHELVDSTDAIFEIAEGSLRNLRLLEKLSLNKVPIKGTIKRVMLEGLMELRKLELSSSKIESIDDFAFASSTKLQDLDLSGNKIKEIRKEMFHNLTALTSLNLGRNKIQYFGAGNDSKISPFGNLKQLKVLNLKGNKISRISNELFDGLNQLHSLYIEENYITFWSVSSLPFGSGIKLLFFGHNKISRITEVMLRDFTKFPQLETLDFSYNPFDCSSCDIIKFHDWWQKRRSIVLYLYPSDSLAYTCDSPYETKGKIIFDVNNTDDKCLPPVSHIVSSTPSTLTTEHDVVTDFENRRSEWRIIIGISCTALLVVIACLLMISYMVRRTKSIRSKKCSPQPDYTLYV